MDDKNCRMLVVSDDRQGHVEQTLTQLDVDVGRLDLDRPPNAARATDPLPHAIVLDVRHREEALLREIKRHSHLGVSPVLVFLSDRTEARVKDLYAAGAALVFLKPAGLDKLRQALQRLVSLWCEFVTPPPQRSPLT